MERSSHAQQEPFHFETNTENSHKKLYSNENKSVPRLLRQILKKGKTQFG